VYTDEIILYSPDDVVLCKAFYSTLCKPTLDWLAKLLPYSIECFDVMTTSFATYFEIGRSYDVTPISLLNIQQEDGESLRPYIDRFGSATLKVKDLYLRSILHYG